MPQIQIYDTLRDGSQSADLTTLTADQKLRAAEALGQLATSASPIMEEFAWPGSNSEDARVYELMHLYDLTNVIPTVFGSTRKPGTTASRDPNIMSLIGTMAHGVRIATIFGKSDIKHVRYALRTTPEENLAMVKDSVTALKEAGMQVIFDAEHYFDGFARQPAYALEVLKAAAGSGAQTIVLCDTNGGMLPREVTATVKATRDWLLQNEVRLPLGIHVHNDTSSAVANSLEAIAEGVSHVQGCIIPIGERTGNADLASIIGNLHFKFRKGIYAEALAQHGLTLPSLNYAALKSVSDFVYAVTGVPPNPRQAFVGDHAGRHTAGVHQDSENKLAGLYSAFNLAEVGNIPKGLVWGLQAGTANIAKAVSEILGRDVDKRDPRVAAILAEVKAMSAKGYSIGFLTAEQELLVHRHFGWEQPFQIKKWHVSTGGDGSIDSSAQMELRLNGDTMLASSYVQNNGPVDAMYVAIMDRLRGAYPDADSVNIVGFGVSLAREEGAASPVRVYIGFGNHERRWGCIGVSTNIMEAAKEALEKGVNHYFLKNQHKI